MDSTFKLPTITQFSKQRNDIKANPDKNSNYEAFKQTILNKEEKIDIKQKFNLYKGRYTLRCNLDKSTIVRIPILHIDCKQHQQFACFDIYNLFDAVYSQRQTKCCDCDTDLTDISKLYISAFHQDIISKINELTDSFYYLNSNLFFLPYLQKNREDIVERNIEFLQYLSSKQPINSFTQLSKQGEYFYNSCSFDSIRIIIPIKHVKCEHLGYMDLSSYLLKIAQKANPAKCKHKQCKQEFKWNEQDLKDNFFLDKVLFDAVNKGYRFNKKYVIQPDNTPQDYQIFSGKDEYIEKLFENLKKEQNYPGYLNQQEIHDEIIKKMIGVCLQQEIEVPYKYKNNIFFEKKYDIGLQIDYPSRCKKCTDYKKYTDLRFLLFNFQIQLVYSTSSNFTCPLCNYEFKDMEIEQQSPSRIFLYDNYLNQYLSQNQSENYQGKNILKEDLIHQHKRQIQNDKTIEYPSILCQKSKKKLRVPIIQKNCPHNYFIDFNSFYELLFKSNNQNFKNLKFCVNCNPIDSIKDLCYDKVLASILPKLPDDESDQQIIYDINKNKFYHPQFSQFSSQETSDSTMNIQDLKLIINNRDLNENQVVNDIQNFLRGKYGTQVMIKFNQLRSICKLTYE